MGFQKNSLTYFFYRLDRTGDTGSVNRPHNLLPDTQNFGIMKKESVGIWVKPDLTNNHP